MKSKRSGKFVLKQVRTASNGVTYDTFLLSGWLDGCRIRKHFKDRDEALGEKNALEIEAENGSEIRVRATRLSPTQLAEAEAAMTRLGRQSLTLAVDWFLVAFVAGRTPAWPCLPRLTVRAPPRIATVSLPAAEPSPPQTAATSGSQSLLEGRARQVSQRDPVGPYLLTVM
jgi:hypothetical protein